MRKTILFLTLVPALLFTTACSTVQHVAESPETRAVVHAAIQVAVMRTVGTAPDQAAQVAKWAGITMDLAGLDEVTTTGELESALRDRLAEVDLTPEEQELADAVIAAVRAQIRARIDDSALSGDALVEVVAALAWLRDTAASIAAEPNPAPEPDATA